MAPLTAARSEPRVPRTRMRSIPWELVVALLAALLVTGPLVRGPHFVDRLTIENPLPYEVSIDVTSAKHDGWMGVAIVPANKTDVVSDVVDQGRTWVFRVESHGVAGGEFRIERSLLDRARWRIAIPADVGTRLRDAGALPALDR